MSRTPTTRQICYIRLPAWTKDSLHLDKFSKDFREFPRIPISVAMGSMKTLPVPRIISHLLVWFHYHLAVSIAFLVLTTGSCHSRVVDFVFLGLEPGSSASTASGLGPRRDSNRKDRFPF